MEGVGGFEGKKKSVKALLVMCDGIEDTVVAATLQESEVLGRKLSTNAWSSKRNEYVYPCRAVGRVLERDCTRKRLRQRNFEAWNSKLRFRTCPCLIVYILFPSFRDL